MSLINNMLKDLDQRQAPAPGAVPSLSGTSVQVTTPPPKRRSPVLIPTLLVVLVAAAYLGWNQFRKSPVQLAAAPVATVAAAPNANPASTMAPTAASTPMPKPAVRVIATTPAPVRAAANSKTSMIPETKPVASNKEVLAKAEPPVTAQPNPAARVAEAPAPAAVKPAAEKQVSNASPAPLSGIKVTSPQQRSDNLYRQAIALLQQSRTADAQQALRQAVAEYEGNQSARQLLAASLIDAGRHSEATALLQQGLLLTPGHSGFSMLLARLQVADGNTTQALSTLEGGLADAGDSGEYHAFFATLLQGQGKHAEAITHYITALRSNPSAPSWLIGAGISLAADNKLNDAVEAFQRALDVGGLSPELTRFADAQVQQIRQSQGRAQ